MKKTIPLKSYFTRAKIFGYVLLVILIAIVGYFAYHSYIE